MRARFVHLGVNPVGAISEQPLARIPENFNGLLEGYLGQISGDWYRYASQNYVLWTDRDLTQIAMEIARLPGFQVVYVFVTEIPAVQLSLCSGWMPEQFWNWLRQWRQ